MELLLDNLCFPEGPRFRDGRLWFSDMHDRKVMTVDLNGESKVVVEVRRCRRGLDGCQTGRC